VLTFPLADNPALSFVNADSLVLQQLFWFGEKGWEPELLPWWRHFCTRSSAILELGANVGYYTVQGGKVAPDARYVAVEPHPVSVEVCRENLALNLIASVEVIAAAAVAERTQTSTQLVIPWEQLSTPTVAFMPRGSELPDGMTCRAGTVIDVPVVDVRLLLSDMDVLKIDVEGQEYELLRAGWEHLRARRPTVFVEVLPGSPKLRALLVELCENVGYRCYAASCGRLFPLPTGRIPTVVLQHEYGNNDLILSADPEMPTTSSDLDATPRRAGDAPADARSATAGA
jgi:FkbM family methyltransferase